VWVRTDRGLYAFQTLGGHPHIVQLSQFQAYGGAPLLMWQPMGGSGWGYTFTSRGAIINTRQLYFEPLPGTPDTLVATGNQPITLALRATLGPDKYLEQRYTFQNGKYDVGYHFVLAGVGPDINDNTLKLAAVQALPTTELSVDNMRQKATVVYASYEPDPSDAEVDEVSAMDTEGEPDVVPTSLKWVAFKNQFFSTVLIAQDRFTSGKMWNHPLTPETASPAIVKTCEASMGVPYRHLATDTLAFTLYFGPNDVGVLRDYNMRLEKLVDLGWGPIHYVGLGLRALFKLLENLVGNYGIIIFIIAVLVKIVLWPLTHKSFLSQAKMGIVNKMPEMKEINEKYKDEPTKLQQEKMRFYGQVGVSPFGGCLPMVLQMPILIAMFFFFPNSIELRQQGFLWATDLSTYDSVLEFGFTVPMLGNHLSLFCMLWVLSQFATAYIQQRQQGDMPGQPKMMKYLPYVMPLIFLGIFNNYSSGLSYYYLLYNLLTLGQTFALKKFFVSEAKMRAEIEAYRSGKAKPKGGGLMGWMNRMQAQREEMMEQRYAQMQGRTGRRALERQQQTRQGHRPPASGKKKK
jgi:YidC/Oxa1 family membrane protein insertase